jgi:hypothetical protein|mmetsp:Transcript_31371/g.48110  ORF Transcript_31371/g.48110 Transcript_31371/m.48110 type:complete len:282 (-) Transcript_31371:1394-2239(-)
MKFCRVLSIFLAVLPATKASYRIESSTPKSLRSRTLSDQNSCKLFWKYEEKEAGDVESLECEIKLDSGKIRRLEIEGLSDEWMSKHRRQTLSGRTRLVAPNFIFKDDYTIQVDDPSSKNSNTYVVSDQYTVVDQEHHETTKTNHRDLQMGSRSSKGRKRAVVVHITAKGGSKTPFSPKHLSENFFGKRDDSFSLSSQMNSCSHGQLDIVPATGKGITNGVYSMNVDIKPKSSDKFGRDILNAALDQLREDFTENLEDSFDHIMVCIPKGVKPFTGKNIQTI